MNSNCLFQKTSLPGVFIIDYQYSSDARGDFSKIFKLSIFSSDVTMFRPSEIFFTSSKKDVVRGMHYQEGVHAHDKLVSCLSGSVLDVVVDIRPSSDYFNIPFAFKLSKSVKKSLFICKGLAHGFLSLEDDSSLMYLTSTEHNQNSDKGILWSSIDFKWPVKNPILSSRDLSHPSIKEFLVSPIE